MTMDFELIKADILSSLKTGISSVIKKELKNVLADDFDAIKSELQTMRTEIASNTAAMHSDIEQMKENIKDVEGGLSTWSDEMVTLQATVTKLTSQVDDLKEKCEDMEGRMRRGNIRITGIPEQPGSSTPIAVSKLLKDMLQMDREENAHRSSTTVVKLPSSLTTQPVLQGQEWPSVMSGELSRDDKACDMDCFSQPDFKFHNDGEEKEFLECVCGNGLHEEEYYL